jgi:predicted aldo/keto reductase-like oxidoreductase
MKYREDRVSGNRLSILGLGCMRFSSSMEETEQIILTAIDKGVNYIDTAFIYQKSEETLGTILNKNKKRSSVFIATKLPLMLCKGPNDFDKFLNKSLERLQTDYIDYYLLHAIAGVDEWEIFHRWGIEQWLDEKKREGKIRQSGFSFHGPRGDFLNILDSRKWDFCQIQYNYSNENYQAGKAGLKAAFAKGIPVIIMEPLLGGQLATGLPKEAINVFANINPSFSPASWGLRWLWNQEEVICVLSGMNTVAQVEENSQSVDNFNFLTENELTAYNEVIGIFNRAYKIHCTGCNYCMPCPQGIDIPGCFSIYNTSFSQKFGTVMPKYLICTSAMSKKHRSPRLCVKCGQCEKKCPQHLPISNLLKQVTKRMEPIPIRIGLSISRIFLNG